ncbi:hypothetical protein BRM1_03065 [Brevibacterium sp. BRM-1]|uniref:hypothetical protein n=1 Tax=Brevibacterium sp. BRM-1 TaxID=2999062 RepID=UPI00227EA80F|nr:hypothetical protein [Brevibacterium sp. BRM-1]WAL40866.1 hypothetical protein BRM1_03065 [Brevibacterium sp. BRM-1]
MLPRRLRPGRVPRGPLRAWLGYAAALLALTLLINGELVSAPGSRVFAENDDSSLFVWWFAHAADVAAGWFGAGSGQHGLLYATAMNAPTGANGAWNTSVLGLALPAVPLTLAFGPIVAYNVCLIAAPVVSALAAAWLLSRFTLRLPAFVGGLAYGFSTYVIAQSAGHLNLAFAPFPPLVALALVELSRSRGARRPLAIGAALGALVGWQFYVSTELLAGSFIAACALALAWLVCAPRSLVRGLRSLTAGCLVAVGIAALGGLPLVLEMTHGPGAPRGVIRPHGIWNQDLLDMIAPGRFTLFGGGTVDVGRVTGIDPSEIGGYVGLAWLVFAAVALIAAQRTRWAGPTRVAALAGVLVWLMSLGSPWLLDGEPVLRTGPFRLIELLPVLGNILPMRLAVHVTLALAFLLAIGLQLGLRARSRRRRALVAAAAAVALVAVAPATVHPRDLVIPEFYRDGAAEIPLGAQVKTLPHPMAMAVPRAAEPMLWQAVAGMRYRERGGYFVGSTAERPVTYESPPDALDDLFEAHRGGQLPAGDSAEARAAIEEVRRGGTDFVVIARDAAYPPAEPQAAADLVAAAAGTAYRETGGVYLIDLRASS